MIRCFVWVNQILQRNRKHLNSQLPRNRSVNRPIGNPVRHKAVYVFARTFFDFSRIFIARRCIQIRRNPIAAKRIIVRSQLHAVRDLIYHRQRMGLVYITATQMDGFETLEEIRKESSLPILMFTSKNDSASKVRGLRAGADDYLTKPFDMDELIARIVSLIRRYTRFNQQDGISQQLEFDGLKIDIENRSVTTENGTFELPPKEFDLLLYCAKNQGKILTKQQIYEEVWREEYFYDDSNIMAIISRLRKKLEVNPGSPKYIQTIKGIGYRFNKEV